MSSRKPKKLPALEIRFERTGSKVTVHIVRQIQRGTRSGSISFGSIGNYIVKSYQYLEMYPKQGTLYLHGYDSDRAYHSVNFNSIREARAAIKAWALIIKAYKPEELSEEEIGGLQPTVITTARSA